MNKITQMKIWEISIIIMATVMTFKFPTELKSLVLCYKKKKEKRKVNQLKGKETLTF